MAVPEPVPLSTLYVYKHIDPYNIALILMMQIYMLSLMPEQLWAVIYSNQGFNYSVTLPNVPD